MEIALDSEQKAFVIKSGNSVSSLDYQLVYAQACELAGRLKAASEETLQAKGLSSLKELGVPHKSQIGTLEQYSQYRALLAAYSKLGDKATWFDARTPKKVQRVLEEARKSKSRLRIFYGDTDTGRDWMEEFDMVGRVSRSTGTMKIPELRSAAAADSSPTLRTHCIVRIIKVKTGEECYRHKTYHCPRMELHEAADYDRFDGYTHTIKVEKEGLMDPYGNFKSQPDAEAFMAFMNGTLHDYTVGKLSTS
jgi:hypothetical protein